LNSPFDLEETRAALFALAGDGEDDAGMILRVLTEGLVQAGDDTADLARLTHAAGEVAKLGSIIKARAAAALDAARDRLGDAMTARGQPAVVVECYDGVRRLQRSVSAGYPTLNDGVERPEAAEALAKWAITEDLVQPKYDTGALRKRVVDHLSEQRQDPTAPLDFSLMPADVRRCISFPSRLTISDRSA